MRAFPIRNEEDHSRALELVDQLWDAQPGSPEHDLLFVMAELIESYEVRNRAQSMVAPDPLVVVRFKLKELGISQRELGRRLGWPTGRVSEVLAGKRQLTLNMVRDLERVLGIDPGVLIGGKPRATPPIRQHELSEEGLVWVQIPAELALNIQKSEGMTKAHINTIVCRTLEQSITTVFLASRTQCRFSGHPSQNESATPIAILKLNSMEKAA